ncbi:hypothetical protein BDV10DRAFT_182973 [Aspergillus recurvatus]
MAHEREILAFDSLAEFCASRMSMPASVQKGNPNLLLTDLDTPIFGSVTPDGLKNVQRPFSVMDSIVIAVNTIPTPDQAREAYAHVLLGLIRSIRRSIPQTCIQTISIREGSTKAHKGKQPRRRYKLHNRALDTTRFVRALDMSPRPYQTLQTRSYEEADQVMQDVLPQSRFAPESCTPQQKQNSTLYSSTSQTIHGPHPGQLLKSDPRRDLTRRPRLYPLLHASRTRRVLFWERSRPT